jgi:hypothetical protein
MYGGMCDSGEETEYFDEERYVKEGQKYYEEQALKMTNNTQRRKSISRTIKPRSNAPSNGAMNHTQPMQQLPNNSGQTLAIIWTIVLTLFVVVVVFKATCQCTCTLHI